MRQLQKCEAQMVLILSKAHMHAEPSLHKPKDAAHVIIPPIPCYAAIHPIFLGAKHFTC